jgi:hypothetical protein
VVGEKKYKPPRPKAFQSRQPHISLTFASEVNYESNEFVDRPAQRLFCGWRLKRLGLTANLPDINPLRRYGRPLRGMTTGNRGNGCR